MAKNTAANLSTGAPCLLILLNFLNCLIYTLCAGIDSVSCNFTVKYRTSPGQCSVNGEPLFHFPDEKLGKGGNVTEVCADLYQSLEKSFDKMLDLEPELFNTKGNRTLQVNIQSKYDQGEFIDGLWAFTIDGQHFFYFYPK
ncbi:histocompatibility antigen 60b-like, partial [Mastomys coucha]|uniref:histocompatibility antigen 60b-like n=1 Tax=Mastomys coucha TaxID=35658 RepID=UPI0012626F3E